MAKPGFYSMSKKNNDLEIFPKDEDTAIRLWSRYIRKLAQKYCANQNEYDDYYQEAAIGLLKAMRDYNPERSKDWKTYAIQKMRSELQSYRNKSRTLFHVPQHISKVYHNLSRLAYSYRHTLDRDAAIERAALPEHPKDNAYQKKLKSHIASLARNAHQTYEEMIRRAVPLFSIRQVAWEEVPYLEAPLDLSVSLAIPESITCPIDRRIIELLDQGLHDAEIAKQLFFERLEPRVISRQAIGLRRQKIKEHMRKLIEQGKWP